jgi:hypothetical protein
VEQKVKLSMVEMTSYTRADVVVIRRRRRADDMIYICGGREIDRKG